MTDATVVNNIKQYVVVTIFFCCELSFGCKNNYCSHIYFRGNIIYYNKLISFWSHRINCNVIYVWQYNLSQRCWSWPYNVLPRWQSVATHNYSNVYLCGNTLCCHDIGSSNKTLMQCFVPWQLQVLQYDNKNCCNAPIASKVIATGCNKSSIIAILTCCNNIRPIATIFALLRHP